MKEIRDDVSMVFEGPNYMLHCCEKIRAVLECEQLDLLYDLRPPTKLKNRENRGVVANAPLPPHRPNKG